MIFLLGFIFYFVYEQREIIIMLKLVFKILFSVLFDCIAIIYLGEMHLLSRIIIKDCVITQINIICVRSRMSVYFLGGFVYCFYLEC